MYHTVQCDGWALLIILTEEQNSPCNILLKKSKGILRVYSYPQTVTFHVSAGFSNSSFQLTHIFGKLWKIWGLIESRVLSGERSKLSGQTFIWSNLYVSYRTTLFLFLSIIGILNQIIFKILLNYTQTEGMKEVWGTLSVLLSGSLPRKYYYLVQNPASVKSAVRQSTEINHIKDKKTPVDKKRAHILLQLGPSLSLHTKHYGHHTYFYIQRLFVSNRKKSLS